MRRLDRLELAALHCDVYAPHKPADRRKRRKRGGLHSRKIFCPLKKLAVEIADLVRADRNATDIKADCEHAIAIESDVQSLKIDEAMH